MPAIRPSQFSALKALDPLHQQPQRGEDDYGQADVEQVRHGPSSDCAAPGSTSEIPGDHAVLTGAEELFIGPLRHPCGCPGFPNRTHAAGRVRPCYHGYMRIWAMSGRDRVALLGALVAPLALSAVLVPFRGSFANTDAALALILVVVAVAANGYRLAGILAAISAAAWFDFFLTHPNERFTITRRTDLETTILLLFIGVAVTEIAVWGRRQHAAASRRAGYLDGIHAAAQAAATGSSPIALIDQVASQLTRVLSLQACRFQYGAAGLGRPARMRHDGSVLVADRSWDVDARGFPTGTDTELLVEGGGVFQGRFLMTPGPGTRPAAEQRLLAVALADQVGAALATSHPVGQD